MSENQLSQLGLIGHLSFSFLKSIHSTINSQVNFLAQVPLLDQYSLQTHTFIIWPFVAGFVYYFALSGIYFIIDVVLTFSGTIHKHKLQNQSPLNWKTYGIATWLAIINQFVVTLPLLIIWGHYVLPYMQTDFDSFLTTIPFFYKNSDNLQILFNALWKIPIILICEEIGFYGVHRIVHEFPFLYHHIHSVHHLFYAPMAVSATAAHPIEHLTANLLPLFVGPVLAQVHFVWFILWLLAAMFNTLGSHSGFNWSFVKAEFHDLHHEYLQCNYGVLFFGDWYFKTRITDMPHFMKLYNSTNGIRDQIRSISKVKVKRM